MAKFDQYVAIHKRMNENPTTSNDGARARFSEWHTFEAHRDIK